ncbi:hypothetical protein [Streptomyces sp. TR02-1]|uniref:hypothetical protein n=1 Tax=Streptomyces sp. TR02-1 TaxID=3385977 RepID=UPI0039A24B41
MTPEESPRATDDHPEVDELSELAEGLLSVPRAREVRTHLADCLLCTEVHQALEEIRGSLGTLPGPGRMPTDVAGRIDAALSAEALLAAQDPGPVSRGTSPEEPVTVSRETGPARTARTPLPTTSGPRSRRRPDSNRPGGKGPGSPDGNRPSPRRGRRARVLLTTAGVLAALGLGGGLFQALSSTSPDSSAGRTAAREQSQDSALGSEELEHRVQALLTPEPAPRSSQPGLLTDTGPPEGTPPQAGSAGAIPSCVRAAVGRPEAPLAAEPARRYVGRPSYLLVLPHPGNPQRVDAYVIDSACTKDPGGATGKILAKHSFTRN